MVTKKQEALQKTVNEYAALQRQIKDLNDQRQALYDRAIQAMEKAGIDKIVTPSGSLRLYSRTLRHFDVDNGREVLGKSFEDVSKVSIDSNRLDAKVKLGEIDSRLVEKFCTSETKMELRLY